MQAICMLDRDERTGHNPDRGTKQNSKIKFKKDVK
jgi:hypothetical protein